MDGIGSLADYWDHYARTSEQRSEHPAPALAWTQWGPGHGPGSELLETPRTVLDLGSGGGEAVAALALAGVHATGVDLSPEQCRRARSRWGHLPGAVFAEDDAVHFLRTTPGRWDAIISIWGAVWTTPPEILLPLIHDALVPAGRLVFSHAPPVPGCYGQQGMYAGGFRGRQVWAYRYAFEPEDWHQILTSHGFHAPRVQIQPAPEPDHLGTLIGTAHTQNRSCCSDLRRDHEGSQLAT